MVPKALLSVLFPLVLLAASCTSTEPGRVTMTGHSFEPGTITVSVGETVTWVNEDGDSHSVIAYEDQIPPGAAYFASGGFDDEASAREDVVDSLLQQGETFEVTFDTTGTYEYFCIPHESEGMKGTVVVQP